MLIVLLRFIVTGFLFWAALRVVSNYPITSGIGRLASLTGPMRLRFCNYWSVILCGALAALAAIFTLYFTGIFRYLLPARSENSIWTQPDKIRMALIYVALAGAIAGGLRKLIRKRWPHAIETPWATMVGGAFVGKGITNVIHGGGYYIDEILLPALALPFVYAFMCYIDSIWGRAAELFLFGYPLAVAFFIPVYGLWAWFHSGVLSWCGVVSKAQLMYFTAYETLIQDDQIQQWLGDVKITAEAASNRYTITGRVPKRTVLNSLRIRLEGIGNAEVDTSAVSIDPTLQPDYRRLTALARNASFASRRKTVTK